MRRIRKSVATMTVIILAMVFSLLVFSMAHYVDSLSKSNDSTLEEFQLKYAAYGGIEKMIYEVSKNKDYNITNLIDNSIDSITVSNTCNSPVKNGDIYTYSVESEASKSKNGKIIKIKIKSGLLVDYTQNPVIIKLENIKIS